jgi:hypothetical protein
VIDPIIAHVVFVDGTNGLVFEQLNGRQYVLDDDCERVYAIWLTSHPTAVVASSWEWSSKSQATR